MAPATRLGSKIRALRKRESLTQVQLAERLGISASYLNLIEHNRRPVSAQILIKVAQLFQLDLSALAEDDTEQLITDLLEVFGDGLLDGHDLAANDVREFAANHPSLAKAVVALYHSYQVSRESADALAARFDGAAETTQEASPLPPEEVTEFVQKHMNYFPELEEGAEQLRYVARLGEDDLFIGLARHAKDQHGVTVRIDTVSEMKGAVRRFDPHRKLLRLSEVLRRGSRNFQLAHQLGLLGQSDILDHLVTSQSLTSDDSRALCRIALANYFAAAVLMPYDAFLNAARAERYDVELLGHRFRTSFEQVCHRLTNLRRRGNEGIPFHLVRVDIAGNISKRFSASGIRFARFSAACPRWNVHAAFLTPGMMRVQLSRMPDGTSYFCIARTLRKDGGGYHTPHAVQAIGLGCQSAYAKELVYADGMDLENSRAAMPVGVTCRLCERTDCEQRAFPALTHRLPLDENIRGVSFYATGE